VRAKSIVNVGFLASVAANLLALSIKESWDDWNLHRPQRPGPHVTTQDVDEGESDKVLIYSFHGTSRCPACRRTEVYAPEVLGPGFADALRSGKGPRRVINVDEPENTRYVQGCSSVSNSLIGRAVKNRRERQRKNLRRFWELVGGKEVLLQEAEEEEVKEYMEDSRSCPSS